MQIETDKVTIDVRYTENEPGTLVEYLVKEDDTVAVGQEVVKVDKGTTPQPTAVPAETITTGPVPAPLVPHQDRQT